MLRGRRRTEMRLEGDIAEILERDDAELIGMAEDTRHRHRHFAQQLRDVDEGKCVEIDRSGMHREDLRGFVLQQHAEVASIGRVAGQRHHLGAARLQLGRRKERVDPIAHIISGASIH